MPLISPFRAVAVLLLGAASCSKDPPPTTAPPATSRIEVPSAIRVQDVWPGDALVLPAPDTAFTADARAAYVAFAAELDVDGFIASYPGIARALRSGTRVESLDAVRMCGASHDLRAIPLLVRELDRPDREHQVWTSVALREVVNAYELKRRDPARPEHAYLLPRAEGSINLRPLYWVLDQMLRSGDPTLQGSAATMSSYIGIHEFAPLLQGLRASRHPAVVGSVDAALRQLALDPSR